MILVRTAGDAANAAADVTNALRNAGKGNALGNVRPLSARVDDAMLRTRLVAEIVSVFAGAALLLAALGVYGSLSLTVMQRSRELAIRRALGADRASLVGMVVVYAARFGAAGGGIGLAMAWLAARGLTALLDDARPLAPAVYGGSLLLLAIALAAASTIPSVRSMRADPRDAMRAE